MTLNGQICGTWYCYMIFILLSWVQIKNNHLIITAILKPKIWENFIILNSSNKSIYLFNPSKERRCLSKHKSSGGLETRIEWLWNYHCCSRRWHPSRPSRSQKKYCKKYQNDVNITYYITKNLKFLKILNKILYHYFFFRIPITVMTS